MPTALPQMLTEPVFEDIKKLLGKWGDFWADDSEDAVKDEVFVTCLTYLC
jgi:hypothetical protein